MKIVFKYSHNLKKIAIETLNAKKWTCPYADFLSKEEVKRLSGTMHLDLVKDEGIYLMSGAKNRKYDLKNYTHVVYAKGYNPSEGDVYDKCRDAVGGDDFVESLPVTENMLMDLAKGYSLEVSINDDSFSYNVKL